MRLTFILLAAFLGGLIGIRFLSGIVPLSTLIYLPLFIVFSVLSFIYPVKSLENEKYSCSDSFITYLLSLLLSFMLFGLLYLSRNYSKTVLKADFAWDYGFKLALRANGTYKSINSDMFDMKVKYGTYEHYDRFLICKGLSFGGVIIRDTLFLSDNSDYLEFNLKDSIKGMDSGQMKISHNEILTH